MTEETIAFNIFSVRCASRESQKSGRPANGRQVFHNFGAGRVTSVPDGHPTDDDNPYRPGRLLNGKLVRTRTFILSSGVSGRIAKRARGRAPNRYRISDRLLDATAPRYRDMLEATVNTATPCHA